MADTLNAGESLAINQQLTSANGKYGFILQDDGNLTLSENWVIVWASDTKGKGGVRAEMQTDGNFVLYNEGNEPVWATNTSGNSGAKLVLQDDYNLVLYTADGSTSLWATSTNI